MSEPTTSESSPEPQNDESVAFANINTNQDGGTSKQACIDHAVASTSKDDTPSASTSKDKFKSHTLSAPGSLHQYIFNDNDQDTSNDEFDLLRFSDNDEATSSDNSESNLRDSLINEIINTTIGSNESVANKKMMIEGTGDKSDDTQENTSYSDEEADYAINQASNDGGEASKTKDTSADPGKDEQDPSSSDDESDCILSQMKAHINYGGECSKTQAITNKMDDDLSSSDEDAKYIPSYVQTSDGAGCSKAIDVIAGPSQEKNKSNDGEAYNIPSRANPNDDKESVKTEVAFRPSNEGQTQIRPIRNKAERKINYTVPFKKSKKF